MESYIAPHDATVSLKVLIDGRTQQFKLPLHDFAPEALTTKMLRLLFGIPNSSEVIFERHLGNPGRYAPLDLNNKSACKYLYCIAREKERLCLRVTTTLAKSNIPRTITNEDEEKSINNEKNCEADHSNPGTDFSQSSHDHSSLESVDQKVLSPEDYEKSMNTSQKLHSDVQLHQKISLSSQNDRNDFSAAGREISRIPSQRAVTAYNTSALETNGTQCSKLDNEPEGTYKQNRIGVKNFDMYEKSGAPPNLHPATTGITICCNSCNASIPNEHYHCSNCDDGDYDLCKACVDNGVLCQGIDHWLIKRFLRNGAIVASTTETIIPKPDPLRQGLESLYDSHKMVDSRTCNVCVRGFKNEQMVNCKDCPDYDICIDCFVNAECGHNPRHSFQSVVKEVILSPQVQALLPPGRNTLHEAICDGCRTHIRGVRHKCLECPDWDYCSTCIENASISHKLHRFVTIYGPDDISAPTSLNSEVSVHDDVYCDGPLCGKFSSFIIGDRYKCTICNNTDFCASCEASHLNHHNNTHPLIKLKTPVRNVSVKTVCDTQHQQNLPITCDGPIVETRRFNSSNRRPTLSTTSQIYTVLDFQPSETAKIQAVTYKKSGHLHNEVLKLDDLDEVESEQKSILQNYDLSTQKKLEAHFVRQVIRDGITMKANATFEQTWLLRNIGNNIWPAGCKVVFIAGTNMCALDPEYPTGVPGQFSAVSGSICNYQVDPGQTAGFSVQMKAPDFEGNFTSFWHLIAPDGTKFGVTLWHNIIVEESEPIGQKLFDSSMELRRNQIIFPIIESSAINTQQRLSANSKYSETVSDYHTDVGTDAQSNEEASTDDENEYEFVNNSIDDF
ncbi:BgTH12-00688 [Blumeria graminis f. sp. triticale]|uniref:BgTH12-00688 n=1 Tax=Blumeria graminis f. sp. triticale TaxID=1689686 RepID=A0A9W4GHS3_BLUGR|nr:BgTH12-00688 [Blumeria graminis f. sp. triticale]